MLYQKALSVPANTSPGNAAETELHVTFGTLIRLSVFFPPGCTGLVHARVLYQNYQLLPWERGEWCTGDDLAVEMRSPYIIAEEPALLKIIAYNEDTLYSHTVYVFADLAEFTDHATSEMYVLLPA